MQVPVAWAPALVCEKAAFKIDVESAGQVRRTHGVVTDDHTPLMVQLRCGVPVYPATHVPVTPYEPETDSGHCALLLVTALHVSSAVGARAAHARPVPRSRAYSTVSTRGWATARRRARARLDTHVRVHGLVTRPQLPSLLHRRDGLPV